MVRLTNEWADKPSRQTQNIELTKAKRSLQKQNYSFIKLFQYCFFFNLIKLSQRNVPIYVVVKWWLKQPVTISLPSVLCWYFSTFASCLYHIFLNIILIRKRCDRLVVGIKQNFVVSLHTLISKLFYDTWECSLVFCYFIHNK